MQPGFQFVVIHRLREGIPMGACNRTLEPRIEQLLHLHPRLLLLRPMRAAHQC